MFYHFYCSLLLCWFVNLFRGHTWSWNMQHLPLWLEDRLGGHRKMDPSWTFSWSFGLRATKLPHLLCHNISEQMFISWLKRRKDKDCIYAINKMPNNSVHLLKAAVIYLHSLASSNTQKVTVDTETCNSLAYVKKHVQGKTFFGADFTQYWGIIEIHQTSLKCKHPEQWLKCFLVFLKKVFLYTCYKIKS